jgi:hypothetical protein
MKKQLLVLCCISFLLWSCGRNNQSGSKVAVNSADTIMKLADGQQNSEVHKVDVKSVIIHMKSSAMGLTQQIVIYMDDYGKKNATEVTQELMGKKIRQYSITDGEYMYSFSPDTKEGKKTKINTDSPDNINFNAITKEMATKFKLKKTGTATILDRKCDVYTMEFAEAKLKGTYNIWKGIPLKTESEISMMKVSMEATAIEENVAIDAEKFKVPANISFGEVATNQK